MNISLFICFLSFLLADVPDETDIFLSHKQSTTLKISSRDKILIEDGNIIKLIPFQNSYQVIAKKIGSTRIYTHTKIWKIHSLSAADYAYYQALRHIVANKRGLQVKWQASCSLLDGTLLRLEDLSEIAEAMAGHTNTSCKNSFLNQIKIAAHLKHEIPAFLQKIFIHYNVILPPYNFSPFLQFFIHSQEEDIYKERLRSYGFHFLVDKNAIPVAPNIETEIVVTEMRKKTLTNIGLSWPSTIEIQVQQKNIETLPFGWNLQAIEEKGVGKILASPKIISVSGKEAEFLAGGEIPLRALGYRKQEILWKSYGILLRVLPIVDAKNRLRLKLSVEVSMLDASQKVDGIPGFLTNRMSSEFLIHDNEVLVLSGLLKEYSGNSLQGLPGLTNLPILGRLFGSKDYQNNQTELVILVRPKVQRHDITKTF